MRKIKKLLAVLLVIMMMGTVPVHAHIDGNIGRDNVSSFIQNESVFSSEARTTKASRGRVISSATVQISDEGDGLLGVYSDILCHTAVQQIYMVIYLDVWNETNEDWQFVDTYEYSWLDTDFPDEKLTMAVVAFDIDGLSRGKEYRLRASYAAKNHDSVLEVMSARTNGITLD